jgi:glycerophosphoryl diester phosphodiesterase
MPPLVIAHRGASGAAPENTLAAMDLARRQGADMIELDVQRTAGGTLVVFHDKTTRRWNGRPDRIAELDWEELRRLRIGGEPIATFEEVCHWAAGAGMRLNVELKMRGVEAPVAELLRRYELVEQVIVSSFYPDALVALRAVAPELRRGVLMGVRSTNPAIRLREAWPFRTLHRTGAAAWHPAWQLPLLRRLIPLVRRGGYEVNVWTVDDPAIMRRLIALGAHGIISNYPARLRAVVDGRQDGSPELHARN